jgi:hypothetical protein
MKSRLAIAPAAIQAMLRRIGATGATSPEGRDVCSLPGRMPIIPGSARSPALAPKQDDNAAENT